MRSNITVRSNIGIREKAEIMRDADFAAKITGVKRLKQLSRRMDTGTPFRLTQRQKELIGSAVTCAYARNGERTHGLIRQDGSIVCVCRCENTDCARYEECMREQYAKRIVRAPKESAPQAEQLPVLPVSAVYETLHVAITDGEAVYDNAGLLEREMQPAQETEPQEQPAAEDAADYTAAGFQEIPEPDPIISAPPDAHILLNSGPGTGKTYTIIHRLLYLLGNRLCEPESITALCYTRAARDVILDRIRQEVQAGTLPPNAADICVLTFDSYAAYFLREIEDELPADYTSLGYNERIALFTQNITPEDVSTVGYLIVDELQDLVNERAEMVLKLLRCVQCGFLLAGDRCQAIYDFEADGTRTMDSVAFYQALDALLPDDTKRYEIVGNRRMTGELAKLSDEIRQVLLHKSIPEQNRFTADLTRKLSEHCDTVESWVKKQSPEAGLRTAVLCRTNGEAAYLDTLLCKMQIPHETFHGKTGQRNLARWIADVFWDYAAESIGRGAFLERCQYRACMDREQAAQYWEMLAELTGREHAELLEMNEIRRALKNPELLPSGMLTDHAASLCVSTIHKAKGREFDNVCLLYTELPPDSSSAEESRTRYVAVTRAKKELHMLRKKSRSNWFFRKTGSGRWLQTQRQYLFKKTAFCRSIAFGFSQECLPAGFAAGKPERAVAVQQYIAEKLHRFDRLDARLNAEKNAYILWHEKTALGLLTPEMMQEIRSCVNCTDYRYNLPSVLKDIYISDIYTVLDSQLHPDMTDCMQRSQMWLGISLTGYARAEYEKKEKHNA